MRSKRRITKIVLYWIPIFLWSGLIFYLSNAPNLKVGLATPNEILLRKTVHLFEFGILAFLIFRLAFHEFGKNLKRSFFVAFLLALIYATSDEFHQSFVNHRDGNIIDVVVDGIGAFIFSHLALIFYAKKISRLSIYQICVATALFFFIVLTLVQSSIHESEKKGEEKKLLEADVEMEAEKKQDDPLAKKPEVFFQKSEPERKKEEIVEIEEQDKRFPERILIDVPFSSQAPFGVWDDVHQEACEETSLIMMKYYLDKEKLTPKVAEKEIQELKEYQVKKYGHYKDSSMEELVKIAEDYYGIDNLIVIYDFEKEGLKKELAEGNPVIVPAAGRLLSNPNFTPPGPLYHNLVLIGYDSDIIITNDPGTRKGKKYEYDLDVVFNAIHDFEGNKDLIEQGSKAMIVLR